MIDYNLDEERSVLHVRPSDPLSKQDFVGLAEVVDPIIAKKGSLQGLILEVARFPGWENFTAMIRHFRFVHDHHRKIKRVAVVTDSRLGDLGEHLASHFVKAEIKHFGSSEVDDALVWVAGGS